MDALICFLRSGLDCLVLEDFVLDRSALPDRWLEWFGGRRVLTPSGVADQVYTVL